MQEGHPPVTEPPPKAEAQKKEGFFTPLKQKFTTAISNLRDRIGSIQDFKDTAKETIVIQQAQAVIKYGGLEQAKAAIPGLFGIKVEKVKKFTR